MSAGFLWWAAWLCFLFGGRILLPGVRRLRGRFSEQRTLGELRAAAAHLKILQEILESGMFPEAEDWAVVEQFPAPWNRIISSSLQELRSRGNAVLPTLRRFRSALVEQAEWVLEAGVKSAQAFSQATLALVLIPGFALILHGLLPGLKDAGSVWFLLVFFALLLSGAAYLWILHQVEEARYGGLERDQRQWWISLHSVLERIFALISAGEPPDQAWRSALGELWVQDPMLARLWGAQVWDPIGRSGEELSSDCGRIIARLGSEIRQAIQTSLIEGRGCLERLESIRSSVFQELRSRVLRELNLLPQACLKPLFLLVFPGVMLLLLGSLWISLGSQGLE